MPATCAATTVWRTASTTPSKPLSAALLLRYSLGLEREACAVEQAVDRVLAEGYRTRDIAENTSEVITTTVMGDLICERVTAA